MNTYRIRQDTTGTSNAPQPGDYYGVIYKGSLILPLLGIIAFVVVLWLLLRRKRK